MSKGNVEIVIEDLKTHPCCPHGPTILFSRQVKNSIEKFFACAACRDRKFCNFFLSEEKRLSFKEEIWKQEIQKYLKGIHHRKMYLTLKKVLSSPPEKRRFCHTCIQLHEETGKNLHSDHNVQIGLTDYQLGQPSELLPPLENSKKEAQYLFSKSTVEVLVDILRRIGYRHIICIGAPRIHEYVQSKCENLTSILLDMDKRYHNFFGPLEFSWYNMFNNHFFFKESEDVFNDYLQTDGGKYMVLITDPPFGGRTELLATTFASINHQYKSLNNIKTDLPIFWIYPYFMEPQILNFMPNFSMLDFKVEYDNHPLFQKGPKGRKQGSPVRIFTNVQPSLVKLPEEDYKHCKLCDKWVAKENRHCELCNSCTSKNGVTYVHCPLCDRCVKPTWSHCEKCNRCSQIDHKCIQLEFTKKCFNCEETGHKKVDCPKKLDVKSRKRKLKTKTKATKKHKLDKIVNI